MPNYLHVIIIIIIFGLFYFPTTLFAEKLTVQQQQQIVDVHNGYRKQVHVNGLEWSDELSSVAQQWVLHLRNENQCNIVHSHISGLGENLFWASAVYVSNGSTYPQSITPREVVDAWGSEKENYHHKDNSCDDGKVCGHYTQLVWHNTTKVGCAMTVCSDQSQIWSCNYSPPGNFLGEKPY
ncbi:MAG: CAP domain-containing protein [Sulfuricurvum sp.]|nr:CAP domain-containing protein [Sulfuricurvum sp.]